LAHIVKTKKQNICIYIIFSVEGQVKISKSINHWGSSPPATILIIDLFTNHCECM